MEAGRERNPNFSAWISPSFGLPASNVGVNGTCPHRTHVERVADSGTRGRSIDDVAHERSIQHAVPTDARVPARAVARRPQSVPDPETSSGSRALEREPNRERAGAPLHDRPAPPDEARS